MLRLGQRTLAVSFTPLILGIASAAHGQIVTNGLTVHFQADAGVLNEKQNAASDGDNVATWVDQSSGFNVTSSGGHEPVFSAAGFNSHPAIVFTRVQSNTETDYLINTTNNAVPENSPRTVIVVGSAADGRGGSLVTFRTTTATGVPDAVFSRFNVAGNSYVYTDGVVQNVVVPTGDPITSPFVSSFTASSSSSGMAVGGDAVIGSIATQFNGASEVTTGTDGGAAPAFRSESGGPTGFLVGDRLDNGGAANINQGWSGSIAEVLIYDRVLSDAELAQTNGALGLKYGIAVVPEPTSFSLIAFAGVGALCRRLRRSW